MKQGLLDFLQSASNMAAESVSVPVDLISAGLRGFGVPIPRDAVGGSQWMKEKGLTRDVQQSPYSIAGETVGLLAPAMVFANPAKVAGGLLQMGDNLAAPTRLNKQAGAIVWHGSPHKFDRFDASKIGTGEGNQSYGRGLYLAESPDVARSYISAGQSTVSTNRPQEMVARALDASQGVEGKAREWLQNRLKTSTSEFSDIYKTAIQNFDDLKPQGGLYKVDLPDEQIARMLDWDKPLSKQSPAVRQAIQKTRGLLPSNAADDLGGDFSMLYGPQVGADEFLGTMNSLQPNLGETLLQRVGVPGVRYLDQGSRAAGQGTRNFVVFPGNENMLRILERNGQPIGLLGR